MIMKTKFRVEGMDCAACATKIDTVVRRMAGVEDVNVSVTAASMTVHHGADATLNIEISRKVASLGYKATPVLAPASDDQADHDKRNDPDGHDHDEHDHDAHDHSGHDHSKHDQGAHDHSKHDHGKTDHASGQHAGHDHARHAKTETSESLGLHGHDHGPTDGAWWQSTKGRLTIAAGVAVVAAWAIGKLFPSIGHWAFVAAMLVGLVPIARRAFMAAINGMPFTIESLMTIAAVGAVFIGATEEAAAVVFLFLVGELLEGVAAGRARASIKGLTALVPSTAFLEDGGQPREVPAASLKVGAIIMVRPGDRIAADGTIISGASSVDQAPVTGESTPVRKAEGDTVFAGTVNGEAALRVRVTAAAADNTIARVVKLVEEAQESKAPTERFIDRFSRYYTPGVLVVGALVAIIPPLVFGGGWSGWIYKGLAVLLIGCPCALVISTPAAIASALSSGARRGLLMKGGAVLESLGKITTAAMDKTGTLTAGKPRVTDIVAIGRSENEVLALAAALEIGSSHPLAVAVLGKAAEEKLVVAAATDAAAIGGKGVTGQLDGKALFFGSPKAAHERALAPADFAARINALNDEGKTVSVLLVDNQTAGLIAMRDEPRPDAIAGVQALKDAGISIVMLTGDNRRTAEAIGKQLGIEVRAELMPEDKQRIVRELQQKGQIVAKVGDGINDAPALAAADIGIAMGGGTDVALETADAAVLHGRVGDIAAMVDLSRKTMRNIAQNITIALGLKAVFLVTTIIGVTGLWPAILADTGATVLVTANAMRLLRVPRS
jgi:Zn2+/Cd2+-exporting ATPase